MTKAGFEVSAVTNCESSVGEGSFYFGASEGGYGTVAIADGLKSALGIQPVTVFAASCPYRMGSATKNSHSFLQLLVHLFL